MGVDGLLDAFDELESDYIVVHPGRCAMVRNRHASCRRCADACTSGAIVCSEYGITVNQERCVGCGTCVTACPTCALDARRPDDRELFAAVRSAMRMAGGRAAIACRKAAEIAGGICNETCVTRVECLGRVDESLLVGALAAPWAKEAVLVCGECAACEHEPGREVADDVVAETNRLLAAWGSELRVRMSEQLPVDVGAHGGAEAGVPRLAPCAPCRNETESGAGTGALDQVSEGSHGEAIAQQRRLAKVTDAGVLPQHLPGRRRRLLGSLAAVGEAQDVECTSRLWGVVCIDRRACTSCRMCAVFCPTGALERTGEDEEFGLVHTPQACVQCRSCESICPAGAIGVSAEVPVRDIASGRARRIPLSAPAFEKGANGATKHVFRELLGDDAVFDR